MQKIADHLERQFSSHLDDLKTLARIPSVSFSGFPASEVRRSAEAVMALLKKRGLENVQMLEIPGAHPYVYGERLKAPGKPTLLLYAHHDVQPPGETALWKTPPFEPVEKEGPGGMRLYGRGTADDKAGIIVHTAAISSYLEVLGELPINVKVIIEGEEETGSMHLSEFLRTHRKLLDADILVLTDTGNFDCGVPALTTSLRGLIALDVELRGLKGSVHSGTFGGPVPDPAMGLVKMLSGLVDESGKITIPGIMEQVQLPDAREEADYRKIPYNDEEFRRQAGMVDSAKLLKQGINPLIQTWRWPSLTVTVLEASSRKQAANRINEAAYARITIRLVAGMDPVLAGEQLRSFLETRVPWGLQAKFTPDRGSPAWSTETQGPAFEAAMVAMKRGYGKEPLTIGAGGSIPFVKPFAEALGGAPAILIGVEDPYTNAHGENESMLISDLKKSCLSQVHFFSEIAERWSKK